MSEQDEWVQLRCYEVEFNVRVHGKLVRFRTSAIWSEEDAGAVAATLERGGARDVSVQQRMRRPHWTRKTVYREIALGAAFRVRRRRGH